MTKADHHPPSTPRSSGSLNVDKLSKTKGGTSAATPAATVTDGDDAVVSETSSAQVSDAAEEKQDEDKNTKDPKPMCQWKDENDTGTRNDNTKKTEEKGKSQLENRNVPKPNKGISVSNDNSIADEEEGQQLYVEENPTGQRGGMPAKETEVQQQHEEQKRQQAAAHRHIAAASLARLQAARRNSDGAAAAGLAGLANIAAATSASGPSHVTGNPAPLSLTSGGWPPATSAPVTLDPLALPAMTAKQAAVVAAAAVLQQQVQQQQQSEISQPTPQTLLYTVGFGIDPRQSSLDATEAAVRALRDAMERSTVRLPPTNPNNACPFQIHVKIGVPARKDIATRLEPMVVDIARIGSILPRSIPILPIDIVVGGLSVSGHDDPDVSICAAVACVTIQTNAAWERAAAAQKHEQVHIKIQESDIQKLQAATQQQAAAAVAAAAAVVVQQQHQHDAILPSQSRGDPSPWEIVTGNQKQHQEQPNVLQQPRKPVNRPNSMDMLASISAQIRERTSTLQGSAGIEGLATAAMPYNKNRKRPHQEVTINGGAGAIADISGGDVIADGESIELSLDHYKKLPPGKTAKNNKRQFVKHDYHDHSLEQPTPMEETPLYATRGKTNGTAFPIKLHDMLSEIEADGYSYIISWLYHGRSFKIHQQQEFLDIVLPNYFVMTKKSSFLRQLNLYGFNRLSAGPDKGSYYHELFLRGMPFLCRRMTRMKVNGNGIRAAGNPDMEPDFHKMHAVPRIFQSEDHRQIAFRDYNELMQRRQRYMEEEDADDKEEATEEKGSPKRKLSPASQQQQTTSETVQIEDERPASSPQLSAEDNSHAVLGRLSASGPPISKANRTAANLSSPTSTAANLTKGQLAQQQISFPLKLQTMLDKLEADGDMATISWLVHGRGFIVHKPNAFVKNLMPVYFKQTKYSSFQRQLHMYSFQRITCGKDKGAYYHESFLRGKPQLCLKMVRTRINGKGCRKPGNPNTEPDLHSLKAMPMIKRGTKVDIPTDNSLILSTFTSSTGSSYKVKLDS